MDYFREKVGWVCGDVVEFVGYVLCDDFVMYMEVVNVFVFLFLINLFNFFCCFIKVFYYVVVNWFVVMNNVGEVVVLLGFFVFYYLEYDSDVLVD